MPAGPKPQDEDAADEGADAAELVNEQNEGAAEGQEEEE
jgi:hypothetical protein